MVQRQSRDLSDALGAEVIGVDLDNLNEDVAAYLREVLDERGLLLFRNVGPNRIAQYQLSELLRGHEVPTKAEAAAGIGIQENAYISNKREQAVAPFGRLLFHSDGMWFDEPFEVLSLHAVDVEPPVPPTTFVSAMHAWATLPDALRERAEQLDAVHVGGPQDFDERRRRLYGDDVMQTLRDTAPSFTMPIARVNTRTGATVLNVSENHTKEIVGLPPDESDALLDELFAHLYSEQNIYEHEWRNGDLVIWDNVALQHGRPNVTVEGSTRTLAKMGLPLPTSAMASAVQSYDFAK